MYSPKLGRFLSPDPLIADPTVLYDNNWFGDALTMMKSRYGGGFPADGVNLYRYAGNNPTIDTDPSGLRPLPTPLPGPVVGTSMLARCLRITPYLLFSEDRTKETLEEYKVGEKLYYWYDWWYEEDEKDKKKKLYKCFCFTHEPFDPGKSDFYKYGLCSDPPSDLECDTTCKSKGYKGGKCFPP